MKNIAKNNNHSIIGVIVILCLSFFTISCGSSTGNPAAASEDAESEIASSCFTKYADNLDEMLTKKDILKHYKADFEKAEIDYDTIMSSKYSSVMYSWDGAESRTERFVVNGNDYGPKSNQIGVGSLDFYDDEFPIKEFEAIHHTMTEEDMANARKAINKELGKVTDNEQTKKTGKKVGKSIMSKIKFDTIEGVGDAAVWDYFDGCLTVLKGRAVFSITVDVSDDHAVDLELAKKLANEVLAKCGGNG